MAETYIDQYEIRLVLRKELLADIDEAKIRFPGQSILEGVKSLIEQDIKDALDRSLMLADILSCHIDLKIADEAEVLSQKTFLEMSRSILVDSNGHGITERGKVFDRLIVMLSDQKGNKTISFQGRIATLSMTQYAEIQDFLNDGRKIEAIKALRRYTHWGLKEAKDACESSSCFDVIF